MEETVRQGGPRVFLADDPLIRKGIGSLLNGVDPSIKICGEASTLREAFEMIKEMDRKPDMVVADLRAGHSYGMDFIKDMKLHFSSVKVFILCTHDENLYAMRCLKAGAVGYLQKTESVDALCKGIVNAFTADTPILSEKMNKTILASMFRRRGNTEKSGLEILSDRELEIFTLLGQGLTTRQVAEKLFLSMKTVETHRHHIKEKFGLKSATELIQHAISYVQV